MGRPSSSLSNRRSPCCEKMGMKKGAWTPDEDQILISHIRRYGHPNWRALPKQAGLWRCGKSCRLRWTNYLRPDIKRGNFTKEEEETILELHQALGNRWSTIAARLPGRTDNEIKNVWHAHLKKRQLIPKPDHNTDSVIKLHQNYHHHQHPLLLSGLSVRLIEDDESEPADLKPRVFFTNNQDQSYYRTTCSFDTSTTSSGSTCDNGDFTNTGEVHMMIGGDHEGSFSGLLHEDFWAQVLLPASEVEAGFSGMVGGGSNNSDSQALPVHHSSGILQGNDDDTDIGYWHRLLTGPEENFPQGTGLF